MENWGLVTYREVYLVVDENSTFASRQQVALVVAHELAHQWFGNLVTMKWWDDLWLNESFATFASEGMYCKPRAIDSITDRNGKAVDVPGTQCTRKLDKDVARGVSYVLKNVLTQGSGYQRGIGLENASAAKTGTTDDSTQTWMVGYTSGLATASWVGNNDLGGRSLNGLSIGGQSKSYVDGATFAGAQWQWYMNQVKNDYEHKTFTDPSAKVMGTQIVSKLP